jgi:hypothetical protein
MYLPSLPGRNDVADDGLRPHQEAARPDALDGPESNQFDHVL